MILQRLAEHYDRIVASGSGDAQLAPSGYSRQKISFCVVLEPDGRLNDIQSLQRPSGKAMVAMSMIVPGQGKPPGQGLNPCFLWDNAAYMLGWSADPERKERAALAFAQFRQRHLYLEASIAHPAFSAVCAFLSAWTPGHAEEHTDRLVEVSGNFGVFRIAGEARYVHEYPFATTTAAAGQDPQEQESEQAVNDGEGRGMCLVSGSHDRIARLHEPKIKGVAGAQSAGALLVSFNASAYESYGKSQSFNAPVGEGITFRYTNALNHLLDQRDRRVSLGDSTVVFWADHADALEDSISLLFADAPVTEAAVVQEDLTRVAEARHLLLRLRDGEEDAKVNSDGTTTRFFLLGLSPNASRIAVRLWVEADAAELRARLGQHLRDCALADPRQDQSQDRQERLLSVRRIVASTGRAKEGLGGRLEFDTKAVSPQLAGELARSILTGAPYPQSLLATMLRRIHADGEVAYARVAAIKACLVRNSRLRGHPMEVSPMLDPTNDDPAYSCGRAFALLEKVQTDSAEGELNATIKDRYFSSASTTPALVFPRLFKLNNHHMAKLTMGSRVYYERRMQDVLSGLAEFPRLLSLEAQGRFVLGYFHQRQDLFTSKKDKAEGATA